MDGLGWLQLARWEFTTGRGRATLRHLTVFGYAINVFRHPQGAQRALTDVKIKTFASHEARLPARRFRSSDAHQTLVFLFFAYGNVEVEAYYEYTGTAPAKLALRLRHIFSRQSSHLAHLTRLLVRAMRQKPPPTAAPTKTSLPTVTPTGTPTAVPTAAPPPTSTPLPTPTVTPSPVPTATPSGPQLQVSMTQPSYAPGKSATVVMQVTLGGHPGAGAQVDANFLFPRNNETCVAKTDANGSAQCSVIVPDLPDATQITVAVQANLPDGESVVAQTTFIIDHTSQ